MTTTSICYEGTYVGNGTSKTIALPWVPCAIQIIADSTAASTAGFNYKLNTMSGSNFLNLGQISSGHPATNKTTPLITTGISLSGSSFTVSNTTWTNKSGVTYFFSAFRAGTNAVVTGTYAGQLPVANNAWYSIETGVLEPGGNENSPYYPNIVGYPGATQGRILMIMNMTTAEMYLTSLSSLVTRHVWYSNGGTVYVTSLQDIEPITGGFRVKNDNSASPFVDLNTAGQQFHWLYFGENFTGSRTADAFTYAQYQATSSSYDIGLGHDPSTIMMIGCQAAVPYGINYHHSYMALGRVITLAASIVSNNNYFDNSINAGTGGDGIRILGGTLSVLNAITNYWCPWGYITRDQLNQRF